jgi:predicted amidohydrolase YtcJ
MTTTQYRRAAGKGLLRGAIITAILGLSTNAWSDGFINGVLADGFGRGKQPAPVEVPVTVFNAKKIITMDPAQPTATAVAVAGKRIIAVGAPDQIKAFLGSRKYKVDDTFKTRVLVPGFIEQQLHPVLAALALSTEVISTEDWVLPGRRFNAANSEVEYLARLQRIHERMPQPNDWLVSWGYQPQWHGKIDRAALDEISSKRPIIIWHRSTQEFFLNTPALKALGVSEESTQNRGEASQELNWEEGHFWREGISVIAAPLLKAIASPDKLNAELKRLVTYLHVHGVTAYSEAGALITPDLWKQYEKVLATDSSPMYGMFIVDGKSMAERAGYEDTVEATRQLVATARDDGNRKLMLLPQQVKLYSDGPLAALQMQMKDGYQDGRRGEWVMQPDQLERAARLYWNAGYQLHIDVNGDGGLDTVLDIIERRQQERPRADHRTVIVGMANANEQQLERIKRLGAIVSTNPYFPVGFADRYGKTGLGQERADEMTRNSSVLRLGIPLSLHSDFPLAPADPLYLAWAAVNRTTLLDRVAGADQKIAVDAALRGVTIEAAYSLRKENDLGSITTGKIANMTVLEKDPYEVKPEKLRSIGVWGTVFEGKAFAVDAADKPKPLVKAVPKEKMVVPAAKKAADTRDAR